MTSLLDNNYKYIFLFVILDLLKPLSCKLLLITITQNPSPLNYSFIPARHFYDKHAGVAIFV